MYIQGINEEQLVERGRKRVVSPYGQCQMMEAWKHRVLTRDCGVLHAPVRKLSKEGVQNNIEWGTYRSWWILL